ncbi:hypothetical protein CTheo_8749 [Ceratobasidium theobromae]|uniref:Uncharacterized protein n=1 Tax=Ceratobasidium theobromae TaxID=1582974 RepID=A0A5N5Q7Z3_9AGAM|nr:hypothetical protein CTheo_8749 [Ceratobasidium theobromae]
MATTIGPSGSGKGPPRTQPWVRQEASHTSSSPAQIGNGSYHPFYLTYLPFKQGENPLVPLEMEEITANTFTPQCAQRISEVRLIPEANTRRRTLRSIGQRIYGRHKVTPEENLYFKGVPDMVQDIMKLLDQACVFSPDYKIIFEVYSVMVMRLDLRKFSYLTRSLKSFKAAALEAYSSLDPEYAKIAAFDVPQFPYCQYSSLWSSKQFEVAITLYRDEVERFLACIYHHQRTVVKEEKPVPISVHSGFEHNCPLGNKADQAPVAPHQSEQEAVDKPAESGEHSPEDVPAPSQVPEMVKDKAKALSIPATPESNFSQDQTLFSAVPSSPKVSRYQSTGPRKFGRMLYPITPVHKKPLTRDQSTLGYLADAEESDGISKIGLHISEAKGRSRPSPPTLAKLNGSPDFEGVINDTSTSHSFRHFQDKAKYHEDTILKSNQEGTLLPRKDIDRLCSAIDKLCTAINKLDNSISTGHAVVHSNLGSPSYPPSALEDDSDVSLRLIPTPKGVKPCIHSGRDSHWDTGWRQDPENISKLGSYSLSATHLELALQDKSERLEAKLCKSDFETHSNTTEGTSSQQGFWKGPRFHLI